jgi:Cu+-exporting ATPase
MTTVLRVEGMSCQNCARHVRDAIQGLPGISYAKVDLDKAEAVVKWNDDSARETDLLKALETAGYPSQVFQEPTSETSESAGSGWKFNVILGSAVTVPLMIAEWGFGLGHELWFSWVSFLLVLPVQVFCGARFYRGAWQQLKVGQSNMDTLVALGSSAAFLFSAYGLLFPASMSHGYFMEAAAIITLISVGHWLESMASSRAAQAVRQLLTLAPATARRLRTDQTEQEVPVSDLLPGDQVVLRPGDRVPIDGIVSEGSSAVDETMLTGESVPVEKSPGSSLYTGTVNANGRLVCRVETTGEATALAQIIAVVEKAQNSRANIQRLADRISSVFVPVVIVCAVVTLLAWGLGRSAWEKGIISAVAVLIVACPCAMGLATPAAIMAGANAGAKRGILIRDGVALEKTGMVTSILFDKTGTLTQGKPQVQESPLYFADQKKALALAKTMANQSRHPLSMALADYAKSAQSVEVENWREERGSGVFAQAEDKTIRLGSLTWLKSCGVDMSPLPENVTGTVLGLSADEKLLAIFALEDRLKDGARSILDELRRLGLDVYMVSGDQVAVAQRIGQELGLQPDHIFAGVRPEGKVDVIKALQAKGKRVAFVGDGINDAPALTQADLGIAVSLASDIAKESADIILLKADLEAVPEALQLSRRTLLTIRQNLFWAFFYNIAAIPIAALGFASPILCAAAMGLSDLFLVGNSIRLLSWRPPAYKAVQH